MKPERVRTTISIPAALLAKVDRLVRQGQATSRAQVLEQALRRDLATRAREATDAAFAAMADDDEFQREALEIARAFSVADSETLRLDMGDE